MVAIFNSTSTLDGFSFKAPVTAIGGAFGLGILEVDNEIEARQFGEGDPSVRAGLNTFEICPMRVSAARAKQS